MTSTATKRSRASQEQLGRMVDFLYENPGFTGSKSLKYYGKIERDRIWGELADVLNSLGGAVKTVEQWQGVWRDLKSRTSAKLRDKKCQKSIYQEPTMEIEKRVIAIIGRNNTESNDVEKDFEYEEELSFEMPSTHSSETQELPQKVAKEVRIEDECETKQPNFQEIASKQADALKTLTDSHAATAEIVRKQAEALKLLAECSAANVEVSKSMAEAMKSMSEGIKANAKAINNLANAINRSGNKSSLLGKRKRSEPDRQSIEVAYVEATPFRSEVGNHISDMEDSHLDSPIIVKSEIEIEKI